MTARLVTQVGRRDYNEFRAGVNGRELRPGPVGADRMVPALILVHGPQPGQLWERVAESAVNR